MNHQKTERECGLCGDGHYIKMENRELVCENCSFTPRGSYDRTNFVEPWEEFRRGQDLADERGDRVRMVGGFPSAYHGDGEYEYSFNEGSFNPPRS